MPRLGTGEDVVDIEWHIPYQHWSLAKTIRERRYFIFGTLLVVAIAIFLNTWKKSATVKSVCSTPECIASSVRERMNFQVDPCDDFYSFACGNFAAQTGIPSGKLTINSFSDVENKVKEQLNAMLSDTIHENDLPPFKWAKKLNKICLLSDFRFNELLASISSRFGDWPMESPWRIVGGFLNWIFGWNKASGRSWSRTIAEFRKIGYETNSLLSVNVIAHPTNKTSQIICISPPHFGVKPELLVEGLRNEDVKKYFKTMMDMAVITGSDYARSEIELKRSLEFEMKLANISISFSLSELTMVIDEHFLFTLRSLGERYPYIEWVEYINALLPSSMRVDGHEVVWLPKPSYFTALGDLLNDTPPHVIKGYLIWRAIWSQLQIIPFDEMEKEQRCAHATVKSLTIAVSAMYVRQYFDQSTKGAVLNMVRKIHSVFALIMLKSSWMDGKTWMKFLEKLNAMSIYIGYSDNLMNDFEIEKIYKNFEMDESSFLSSILSINKFNVDSEFTKLRDPMRNNEWAMNQPPFEVNAAYMKNENRLQFPAAILQGNFFSPDRPWYMNFGAIGSIIGHEITHGYDDTGRLNGTICIDRQYGSFIEPIVGLKVDGLRTLRENIADNVGFKLSYLAYQNWEKENGVESKLPGMNYTSQQMFWISAAQMYCSNSKPEYVDVMMKIDIHSPERFRVIGSFRNQKEFAKDFQCPVGSPMNPIEKCEVW